MRQILLDEGVPIGIRDLLPGFQFAWVAEVGWAGFTNGDLIRAAEAAGFAVFVTCDQNMRYQQNLARSRLAVAVLTTKHWDTIRANSDGILPAIRSAAAGGYTVVKMPKPPRRRRPSPHPAS